VVVIVEDHTGYTHDRCGLQAPDTKPPNIRLQPTAAGAILSRRG
jgi:hypothetical protein